MSSCALKCIGSISAVFQNPFLAESFSASHSASDKMLLCNLARKSSSIFERYFTEKIEFCTLFPNRSTRGCCKISSEAEIHRDWPVWRGKLAEIVFAVLEKMFSAFQIIFSLVEKRIGVSPKLFSEAEKHFFGSEKCFCMTEKMFSEAPTVFSLTQNRLFPLRRSNSRSIPFPGIQAPQEIAATRK